MLVNKKEFANKNIGRRLRIAFVLAKNGYFWFSAFVQRV